MSEKTDEKNSSSSFQMVDVGAKVATARTAFARGTIHLSKAAYDAVKDGTNPKGDVLALAEITGIQGAKHTSLLLPLCHPLPIEKVRIRFEKNPSKYSITVFAEVSTTGKTGVEMEALSAVNAALLGIYDLSKAVDPVLEISGIRLDQKIGGKSGNWRHPSFLAIQKSSHGHEHSHEQSHSHSNSHSESHASANTTSAASTKLFQNITASVLTLSDRCFRKEAVDTSGPAIAAFLVERGASLAETKIIPDEIATIQAEVKKTASDEKMDLLILSGGTGASPSDVTPEALASLWTKKIPGVGELLRASGAKHTALSYLSRSEGGMIGNCLVVSLPGSEKAVREGLEALEPLLPHLLHIKNGGKH